MSTSQINLELPTTFPDHVYEYGSRSSGEVHGVVLTKPHVVSLILDLAGYVSDNDISAMSLLEPSCGHGAFLVEAVERLMTSAKIFCRDLNDMAGALRAYDIDQAHVELSRSAVVSVLTRHGLTEGDAWDLARAWIVCDDFLLATQESAFDFVVGNPPYIRIEQISPQLQAEYRRRYETLYDRADLYVAFIEKGLSCLREGAALSFICADRWVLNKYGSALRRIVSERYSLQCYVDLHRASPFESEVVAYPSIFVIKPGSTTKVHVASLPTASVAECASILPAIKGGSAAETGVNLSVYESWFVGDEPWVISTPDNLKVLRELESRFELIESEGTKIGIGVATGNDKVFIVDHDADVEDDRLVPLVMRSDITKGSICDARRFVINTFEDGAGVVDLERYPRLAAYLDRHSDAIQKRHVAQRNPTGWFRTIDRVYPQLVRKPKLLIPDIAGSNEVAFDEGRFHPHHNLYFVTSTQWDMEVLGGILSSKVALFFVWSYAVKMRGGYLRFQAQYLRRIRVPKPTAISEQLSAGIKDAFRSRDFRELDSLVMEAYDLKRLPDFDFVDTRS